MFGFPENPSEWGSKEYLRLFTVIMFYISVRPLLQSLYAKLGERQRARDKKRTDDELIRRHKQERVRQKLGVKPLEEVDEADETAKATAKATAKPDTATNLRNRREARAKKDAQKTAWKEEISQEMPSDDDVSDLVS